MAGYAAVVRIGREQVRPGPAWHGTIRATPVAAPSEAVADDRIEELAGRPLGEILAERVAAFREAWSQTTFFLFDPDSWRP